MRAAAMLFFMLIALACSTETVTDQQTASEGVRPAAGPQARARVDSTANRPPGAKGKLGTSTRERAGKGKKPAPKRTATTENQGSSGDSWSVRELDDADAGRDSTFLSDDEKKVVQYLNLSRMQPRKFARLHLKPLRSLYRGHLFVRPGKTAIGTNEGVKALDECIQVLEKQKSISALRPSYALFGGARDHVADTGPKGITGHQGSNGSSPWDRIGHYGKMRSAAGENISYGYEDPLEILVQLLVDDGVSSRGHRENILNAAFGRVGVSIGPHDKWHFMCVIDFAGEMDD
jgi:uncharacterized protein YkwD